MDVYCNRNPVGGGMIITMAREHAALVGTTRPPNSLGSEAEFALGSAAVPTGRRVGR